MLHTGSMRVHLRNQTHIQGSSRCIWTCIDIQYTPLHANIAYLIYFVCFWCFGRRSAALIKQGIDTSLQQIQGRRIAFYYLWLLMRSLQALHNFKQSQLCILSLCHCSSKLQKRSSTSCSLSFCWGMEAWFGPICSAYTSGYSCQAKKNNSCRHRKTITTDYSCMANISPYICGTYCCVIAKL